MTPTPRSMSVIVPVFNEEAQIATIVPAVREALEARGADWELIVVDNAKPTTSRQGLRSSTSNCRPPPRSRFTPL